MPAGYSKRPLSQKLGIKPGLVNQVWSGLKFVRRVQNRNKA